MSTISIPSSYLLKGARSTKSYAFTKKPSCTLGELISRIVTELYPLYNNKSIKFSDYTLNQSCSGFFEEHFQNIWIEFFLQVQVSTMALYKVKLIDPNDIENEIEVPDDRYILDTAEDAGMELPYSCRAGTCGTCAGQLSSGSVDQSEGSFLDESLIGKGYVLTCISYPRDDCIVHTHKQDFSCVAWTLQKCRRVELDPFKIVNFLEDLIRVDNIFGELKRHRLLLASN
ncbi:hypothetical protein H5410_020068 [Solanum commersonii]|uniref:Ferredoxin n=1 Tax=Solanum commersonii TaxID=4109 RepID=A0A9J5Z704_SOLCO|nr:hypothetical protein H5410_020068 [Solanum commersonii]